MLLYKDLTNSDKYELLNLLASFLEKISAFEKFNIKGVFGGLLLHESINNPPTQAQNELLGKFLSFLKYNRIIQYSANTTLVEWAKEKYNVLTYKVLKVDPTLLKKLDSEQVDCFLSLMTFDSLQLDYFLILMTLHAFLKAIERDIKISLSADRLNITIPGPASEKQKKIAELIDYLKQLGLLNYTIISLVPYGIEVHSIIEKLATVLTEQKIIHMPNTPFAMMPSTLITDQKLITQAVGPQNQTEAEKPPRQVEKIWASDNTLSLAAQSSTAILTSAETMPRTEAQPSTHEEQEKETAQQQQSAEAQKQQEIRELQYQIARLTQLISERPQQLCSSSSPWENPAGPHWLAPPAASQTENESSAVRQYKKSLT